MRQQRRFNLAVEQHAAGCMKSAGVLCALLLAALPNSAVAQTRLPQPAMPVPSAAASAPAQPHLPEIVYWKQDLFLVPYQFSSAADPGTAQAVWLFVSKDNGASWRKVSEATPQVKAFNYRAEGDGEYWFSIQTIDRYGRPWPVGQQPELRVVVDTAMPQIAEVTARRLDTGVIEITARGSDLNLDPSTWKVEAQVDALGNWVAVPAVAEPIAAGSPASAAGQSAIRAHWQPAAGVQPLAIRATVQDRAGNPASYQTQVSAATPATLATGVSEQPWSSAVTSRAPFRLSTSGASAAGDGVTSYGMPAAPAAPGLALNGNPPATSDAALPEARYAGPVVPGLPEAGTVAPEPNDIRPIQPFRQAAVTRLPPTVTNPVSHTPRTAPKLVGSRTFSLEYDLEDSGRWGVSKVELWGTRDGGRTWNCFARDEDQRSPLVATVDSEGLYGFRIVVQSAGSTAPSQPNPGDEPELWVQVDLDRPVIEITGMERGTGNLSDHLTLRWRAADDNLEPRPISLFYSSRPSGPWSAIATNLEDTGEYAWRVERHVPARFYIRAEARDTAGNLAAFQTREPIDFAALPPSGKLRGATQVPPTAEGDGAYR